jgi:hypothetical protein
MKILKKISKYINTEKRFLKIYNKLERVGFDLFLRSVSETYDDNKPEIKRKIRNYIKNSTKIDSLWDKWKK